MLRLLSLLIIGVYALTAGPAEARAQTPGTPQWTPPSREMPQMPRMADLQGDWLSSVLAWFRGTEQVTGAAPAGLRAAGEARPGSERAQIVRFTSGPRPVAVWTDRNGDGRLDMLELYRSGTVVVQLIDADFDGNANVVRILDASGALIREERMRR